MLTRWGDETPRLCAQILLVMLLLTSWTAFTVHSEGQHYVLHSHGESSHFHAFPQFDEEDAVTPMPVLPKLSLIFLTENFNPTFSPRNPVLSLEHPPE